MFAKWFNEYQKLSRKTRFISQFAAFTVLIFSLLSLYDVARIVHYNSDYPGNEQLFEFWISIIFQVLIFILFTLRFGLLFFESSKSFWLSEILSLIGLATLASFWWISRPPLGYYDLFPNDLIVFRYTSRSMEGYGLYYLLLSPLRKFTTSIFAIIKIFAKKGE